jgi:hypothetical protein
MPTACCTLITQGAGQAVPLVNVPPPSPLPHCRNPPVNGMCLLEFPLPCAVYGADDGGGQRDQQHLGLVRQGQGHHSLPGSAESARPRVLGHGTGAPHKSTGCPEVEDGVGEEEGGGGGLGRLGSWVPGLTGVSLFPKHSYVACVRVLSRWCGHGFRCCRPCPRRGPRSTQHLRAASPTVSPLTRSSLAPRCFPRACTTPTTALGTSPPST